jgi:hypothetical protein
LEILYDERKRPDLPTKHCRASLNLKERTIGRTIAAIDARELTNVSFIVLRKGNDNHIARQLAGDILREIGGELRE